MKTFLRIIGLGDLGGQGWRVHFSFWSMVALTFFLFGDQNLIAPNVSRIGAEFGFPEKKDYLWYISGLPQLPFFVLGGLVSIAMGSLTDAMDRRKLLTIAVVVGEVPCLLTAFATDYTTFVILRTLTGLGMGGIFPIIFSLLGDYFQPSNRPAAAAYLSTAMGFGILVGHGLAGAIANTEILGLPGWRFSFILMAAPAFPLALAYYLVAEVPRRGGAEKKALDIGIDETADNDSHRVSFKNLGVIFQSRTNILAFLQGIPGTVPWGFLFYFLTDYYETTKGFKVTEASVMVVVFGVTTVLGTFLGGYLGKLIYDWRRRLLPLFCSATVMLGTLPALVMINYNGTSITPVLWFAFLGGLIAPMTGANVRAILINVNIPEHRGAVFGLYNFADDLGKAFGPGLIGMAIKIMSIAFAGTATETIQLIVYNATALLWIVCGIIWLPMMKSIEADEDRVVAELRRRAT